MTKTTLTEAELIAKYRKLRDWKKAEEDKLKERLAPVNAGLAKIEAMLLEKLNSSGTDSFSARGVGTVARKTLTSVTVEDTDALWEWVLDAEHEGESMRHLLDLRAAKKAIMEYREEEDDIPPGVKISQFETVSITKGRP